MESFHVHIEPFCGGHVSHDLNTGHIRTRIISSIRFKHCKSVELKQRLPCVCCFLHTTSDFFILFLKTPWLLQHLHPSGCVLEEVQQEGDVISACRRSAGNHNSSREPRQGEEEEWFCN